MSIYQSETIHNLILVFQKSYLPVNFYLILPRIWLHNGARENLSMNGIHEVQRFIFKPIPISVDVFSWHDINFVLSCWSAIQCNDDLS